MGSRDPLRVAHTRNDLQGMIVVGVKGRSCETQTHLGLCLTCEVLTEAPSKTERNGYPEHVAHER